MRTAVFSSKPYDKRFLEKANASKADGRHVFSFFEDRLTASTVSIAHGYPAVCVFVNDDLSAPALEQLALGGTKYLVLRCAGFNQVDLKAAAHFGFDVRRVPAYSPYAVAEFTLGMILTLNRKYHRAFNRVREGNFGIDGLLGFDLHGSTVGVVGTGKIGLLTAKPLAAMGCAILGYDPFPNDLFRQIGGCYVSLDELFAKSDIISLHCPLTPQSRHLIDAASLERMKPGVMLINTSRGALVDAVALIDALKSGQVGALGLDVYEQEADLFYEDLSGEIIQDDVLQRLLMFPNVLITSHQAFFTSTALRKIAETTIQNLNDLEAGRASTNQVRPENAYGK
jgi:D-lactate dehydrogenase